MFPLGSEPVGCQNVRESPAIVALGNSERLAEVFRAQVTVDA